MPFPRAVPASYRPHCPVDDRFAPGGFQAQNSYLQCIAKLSQTGKLEVNNVENEVKKGKSRQSLAQEVLLEEGCGVSMLTCERGRTTGSALQTPNKSQEGRNQ
jgi:hypothetical protein